VRNLGASVDSRIGPAGGDHADRASDYRLKRCADLALDGATIRLHLPPGEIRSVVLYVEAQPSHELPTP